jgi:hypothetical protein
MVNGGVFNGQRNISRSTAELIMSDHTGARQGGPLTLSLLLLGTDGYGFGLGLMVRNGPGIAGIRGCVGHAH